MKPFPGDVAGSDVHAVAPREQRLLSGRLGEAESWLCRHADLVALAIVAVGFVARFGEAVGTWLNADEALIFLIADQPGVSAVYRASLTSAHPPLFYLVLHAWQQLGDGEVVLRLLSVIAGSATIWVVYRWLARFSPAWGLTTALLMALLPSLIGLDAEVRQYSLLLLLLAAALATFERATADRSATCQLISGLFLCGATLTHYSAPLVAVALAAVAVLWIALTRPGPRFLIAWAVTQLGLGLVFVLLSVSHIAWIRGGELGRIIRVGYLKSCFFDPAHDQLVRFVTLKTGGVFLHVFGSRLAAFLGLLLFALGIILLVTARPRDLGSSASRRNLAVVGVSLIALTAVSAILGVYPYCNARQAAFLILPILPVTCFPIVWAARGRAWVSLLAGAVVAAGLLAGADRSSRWIPRESQRLSWMRPAIDALRQRVPPGMPVVVDYHTALILSYYLRDGGAGRLPRVDVESVVTEVGGVRMLVVPALDLEPDSFEAALRGAAGSGALQAGETVWVADVGRRRGLHAGATSFGGNIALYTVEVSAAPSAIAVPSDPKATGERR